jgi:hypothetical protein
MAAPDLMVYPVSNVPPELRSHRYNSEELQDEAFVSEAIVDLWQMRESHVNAMEADRKDLRSTDEALGQLLFQMKSLLAKPGRNGGWSAWLVEKNIPRSSADRLVSRFANAIGIKSPQDAISEEPTEIEMNKLVAAVWARIENKLTTPRAMHNFLCCLAGRCSLTCEYSRDGVMIFDPAHSPLSLRHTESPQDSTIRPDDYGDVL